MYQSTHGIALIQNLYQMWG